MRYQMPFLLLTVGVLFAYAFIVLLFALFMRSAIPLPSGRGRLDRSEEASG